MKYKKWLEEWLKNYIQPSSKQKTYTRYNEIISQHIMPNLGELELSQITPYVIQCFVTNLMKNGNIKTGEGLSTNSVNSIITVVQSTLKTASSIGLVDEYVGDKIRRPKSSEKKIECFSMDEQRKIEEYILKNKKTKLFGVVLCLYTGLRIGELLALEWSDVDMRKAEIRVNKTCHYGKNKNGVFGRITDAPKTLTSIRIIPIPKQLIPYLREIKKKSRLKQIVSNNKNPVLIRAYQHSFSLMLEKLNIPHRGFHSLRHTFATRALECGMDVKTLSEILGHKSPTVTLNRYAHSMMEHKKTMMNKLGNSIFLSNQNKKIKNCQSEQYIHLKRIRGLI